MGGGERLQGLEIGQDFSDDLDEVNELREPNSSQLQKGKEGRIREEQGFS